MILPIDKQQAAETRKRFLASIEAQADRRRNRHKQLTDSPEGSKQNHLARRIAIFVYGLRDLLWNVPHSMVGSNARKS
jgi:hypothetical protein